MTNHKFFAEAHPKLKPVETNTAGIFLAGACQNPKDIPDSVSQASGAAVKVAALFSQSELTREPLVAVVNRTAPPMYSTCVGCFLCQSVCPYQAIETRRIQNRDGKADKDSCQRSTKVFARVAVPVLLYAVQNQLTF